MVGMVLRMQINGALKTAIKAKDSLGSTTLRLVNAAVKDRDISAHGADRTEGVSDEEILEILSKMVKQRLESFKTYEEAARHDLSEREQKEIEIIQKFLPAQLSSEEIDEAVKSVVKDLEATSLKNMGQVMSELKTRYSGQMDFSQASVVVKRQLS